MPSLLTVTSAASQPDQWMKLLNQSCSQYSQAFSAISQVRTYLTGAGVRFVQLTGDAFHLGVV
jgi:hypothetical protein